MRLKYLFGAFALLEIVLGACPSTTFVDNAALPPAPVFPTNSFTGAMPGTVLEDHWSEVAQIGAYRPPRITPCANPTRTNCPYNNSALKLWHNPNTWPGNNIPTSGTVNIPPGTAVLVSSCSIDPTTVWNLINIPVGSSLVFADAPISIKTKGIQVSGTLSLGSPTCRLQNKITIELGPGTRGVDTTGLNKGIVVTGTIDMHGVEYAPTWTRLAATAQIGQTTIFVQDLVNWQAGQSIVITTTELKDARDFNHNEEKIILKVERTSYPQVSAITLTTPLTYNHYGGSEYQAEVGLLSRMITIQGDAASEDISDVNAAGGKCPFPTPSPGSTYPCENQYLLGFGGHVWVNGSLASGRFSGVEGYRMGQTNMLGRYPFHFHLVGNITTTNYQRAFFRDCSVHHSYFRCFAVHGTSGVRVSRNVGYDSIGHCFFIEDGVEENNIFEYNLASHIHPLGPIVNPSAGINGDNWGSQMLAWYDESPNMVLPSDMSAAGFYITNTYNDFVGNAASGGWTGFAMPSLTAPVKLFAGTIAAPKNRPFRTPFRGNSAHSSGYWWATAGAFYLGGQLVHKTPGGILSYTAGRSATHDTCSNQRVGTTLDPNGVNGGCWTESEALWLRFEDNKAFLANRGLQNWGERSELVRFEMHNVGLAMNVFGQVMIDQLLMECRTQSVLSQPTWFNGCGLAKTTSPPWGVCNVRDYQYWADHQGFQWYDVGQQHILTNSIFRNCRNDWADCVYGPTPGKCGRTSVFLSLTHSDEFVPQFQQVTNGITLDNCNNKWDFTTDRTTGAGVTISGRLQSWLDMDGSVAGTGRRTMLGSTWAGEWWKFNSACTIPAPPEDEFWVCPMNARDSHASIYFGYNRNQNPPIRDPNVIGSTTCLNGGQSAAPSPTSCPILGQVTHFGRSEAAGIAIPLALNGRITGPLIYCSGGWYVHYNTPPNTLTMTDFQIDKNDVFIIAIPYPAGTTFSIYYYAADWCDPSWGDCQHQVTSTTSLANVKSGNGDRYYWDNQYLWMRVVQRQSTLGPGNQASDPPGSIWSAPVDPEFTFSRQGQDIIEVAYQTFLTISATCPTPTCASVNPGVPAAFISACPAEGVCAADLGWPPTPAGTTRTLPCDSGFYGTKTRKCNAASSWDAVNTNLCTPGNSFCPPDSGYAKTAQNTLVSIPCNCSNTGYAQRQCQANGMWGSAVNTCVGTATCSDGAQNQGETGLDCGGPCPACTFCQTINCGLHGTCMEANPPTCTCKDGFTGSRCENAPVDPCNPSPCGANGNCVAGVGTCNCINGFTGPTCATPPAATCTDGILNNGETLIDCGGANCPACPTYAWNPSNWTACSLSCNGGNQNRTVTCINAATQQVVNPGNCSGLHPFTTTQPCNVDPCPFYSWQAGAFGLCSEACGTGVATRQVDCISSIGNSIVNSNLCDPLMMPASSQTCNTQNCTVPRWVMDPWTTCTRTCGGGTQTRTVTCKDPQDVTQLDSQCPAPKPALSQACNLVACEAYTWKACPSFYPCTAQCNGGGAMVGIQYRDVFCFKDSDNSAVDQSLCNAGTKPTALLSVCNTQKCSGANWMADANWGPCVQNNESIWVRTRTFHCHNADGTSALYSTCQAGAGPLPIAVLPCTPGTCSDSNGCPNVQIGAVLNDCVDGLPPDVPCSPQCLVASNALQNTWTSLGFTNGVKAQQCVTDFVNTLPSYMKPPAGLLANVKARVAALSPVCSGPTTSPASHVDVGYVACAVSILSMIVLSC